MPGPWHRPSCLAAAPLVARAPDAMGLKSVVYWVEGLDAQWRLSLAFRIEGTGWIGRYMYHLPTIYAGAQLHQVSAGGDAGRAASIH